MDPFCYLCFVFIFVMLTCLFLAASGSPAGKWLTSWLSCVLCFLVLLSLSHMVFKVRYGTWLNRFLIFAFLSTLPVLSSITKHFMETSSTLNVDMSKICLPKYGSWIVFHCKQTCLHFMVEIRHHQSNDFSTACDNIKFTIYWFIETVWRISP